MNDLDKFQVEQEARRRSGARHRTTAYSEVVNRYLGAFGYADQGAPQSRPGLSAVPAAKPATGCAVIVGVDQSPISRVAVDHAAIEADLRGCALRILHAGERPQPALLDRLIERVRACAPHVTVSGRSTVGGGAAPALLADAGPAELIVVGHRRGRLRDVLRRSVAERVVAGHRGPVLIVGVPDWPVGPELADRPLVVRADHAAALERAADFAVREARLRGCDVELLHISDEPDDVPDRTEQRRGVTLRHRRVVGKPVTELVDASQHASAMVLGRGAGRRALDTVSRLVLHRAHCPVFIAG